MGELCIPFWVTLILTLTSALISSFFVSGAYLLNYKKNFPHNMCLMLDQFLWDISYATVAFLVILSFFT